MVGKIVKLFAAGGTALFLFLVLVAGARILGPQDFGRFSFAFAFVLLLDPLLDPGLFHRLLREGPDARESGRQYLLHALLWKALAAPVLFFAIRLVVPRIDPAPVTLSVAYLVGASQVLKSMKDAVRATFIAGGEVGREILSLITEWFTLFVVGLSALQGGHGLVGLGWAFLVARIADLAVAWILVQGRVSGISFKLEPRFLWTIFASGLPIAAYYITANLYSYLDTVMLAAMRTQTEVGHYSAAYRVYEGLSILPLLICTILMPRLIRRRNDDPESAETIFTGGLKYAYAVGALAGGNGFILAPLVIRFFFGEGYEPGVDALRILSVGFPVAFALNVLNNALISLGRTRIVFVSAVCGLALNGALNLWLIPRYSIEGAAAATLAVETILFFVFYRRVRSRNRGLSLHLFGSVPLAIALGVGAASFMAPRGFFVQLFAGNLVFVAALLLSGFVGEAERKALLDVFRGTTKGAS